MSVTQQELEQYVAIAEGLTTVTGASTGSTDRVRNALAGAVSGLTAGAAIGTVIPGIGNVLGGAIGAIIGTLSTLVKGRTQHVTDQHADSIARPMMLSCANAINSAVDNGLVSWAEVNEKAATLRQVAIDLAHEDRSRHRQFAIGRTQSQLQWYDTHVPRNEHFVHYIYTLAFIQLRLADKRRLEEDFRGRWNNVLNRTTLRTFADGIIDRITARISVQPSAVTPVTPTTPTTPGPQLQQAAAALPFILIGAVAYFAFAKGSG